MRRVFLNESDQVLWSPVGTENQVSNALENNKDLLPQLPYESKWSPNNAIQNKANKYGYKNSDRLLKKLKPVLPRSKSESEFPYFAIFLCVKYSGVTFVSFSLGNSVLEELGMVKSDADRQLRDNGYKHFAFNVLVSQNLDLHRKVPDTRNKL